MFKIHMLGVQNPHPHSTDHENHYIMEHSRYNFPVEWAQIFRQATKWAQWLAYSIRHFRSRTVSSRICHQRQIVLITHTHTHTMCGAQELSHLLVCTSNPMTINWTLMSRGAQNSACYYCWDFQSKAVQL